MDKVIEYEGKIAVQTSWQASWGEPEEYRITYIGKHYPVKYWEHLLDREVSWTENTAIAKFHSSWCYLDVHDKEQWDRVIETRPVKKPRDGKHYTYVWHMGRWERRSK